MMYRTMMKSVRSIIVTFVLIINLTEGAPSSGEDQTYKRNIVFIIADDLGWDDVSFHGSNIIMTPNIDLLAYTGMALDRHYSHSLCTPSRAALLTGKYAHTIGMHGYPLTNGEDRGLPLTEKILPEYFRELGYDTHLVGKWHLGNSRSEYLPTWRGFDTHFGHRGGYIDYYEYILKETWCTNGSCTQYSGLDMFRNDLADWDVKGYITDVYTDEAKSIIEQHDKSRPLLLMIAHNAPHCGGTDGALLQAPPEEVRALRHIESPERRMYAAMVKKLDDSVGEIFKSLSLKGILNNTVIVFISDNGGMTEGDYANYASNWPLRGLKFSPFEGGIRTVGLIWSPDMNKKDHVYKAYMHVVDWLPTLLKAAHKESHIDVDGKDLWNSLASDGAAKRDEIFEIDQKESFSSIISGDYKLVKGNVKRNLGESHGANLRNVIGTPPDYTEALKRSIVFRVLNDTEKHLKEFLSLRNIMKIDCLSENHEDIGKQCHSNAVNVCLYNIKTDPCETRDLSIDMPDVVERLSARLKEELKRRQDRVGVFRDPRSRPKLHNFTWTTWADNI